MKNSRRGYQKSRRFQFIELPTCCNDTVLHRCLPSATDFDQDFDQAFTRSGRPRCNLLKSAVGDEDTNYIWARRVVCTTLPASTAFLWQFHRREEERLPKVAQRQRVLDQYWDMAREDDKGKGQGRSKSKGLGKDKGKVRHR